jgi:AraC-like DNA-binding protein
MTVLRHRPGPPLSAWVECFWYSPAGRSGSAMRRRSALPSGSMDVVFNLGENSVQVLLPPDRVALRTDGTILHGAQSGYFIIDARPVTHASTGVHFRPGGGAVLLGAPASELSDLHVSLSDLWGASAQQLRAQLIECRDPVQVFQALERALLMRLRVARLPLVNPAISFALRRFSTGASVDRVAPVRQATGYSERHFNSLFQQAVGLSPKRFCRIQRLRAVVEQLARGAPVEWAQVAAANGYFDQSHLNRDFRLFSGVTPGDYRPVSRDSALHMDLD